MKEHSVNPWGRWICKAVAGIVVAGVAYLALLWLDTSEVFPLALRIGIAGSIGILFVLLGRCVWKWIAEILSWM